MNIYTDRDSEGNRNVISEIGWDEGAFVPRSTKERHANKIPWITVAGYPKYECRYFPYKTLTVRNKKTKVECIERYWNYDLPLKGKFVVLWSEGKRIKIDIRKFEHYRGQQ